MNDDGGSARVAKSPCCVYAGCVGVVMGVMRTLGFGVGGDGLTISGRVVEAVVDS